MTAFDFSAVGTHNPYASPGLTVDNTTSGYAAFRSDDDTAATAQCLAPSSGSARLFLAATFSGTIESSIVIVGARGQLVTNDTAFPAIFVQSGANQYKGYYWLSQNGFQRLFRWDAADGSSTTGLAASTSFTPAEGDTLKLSLNTSTNVCTCYRNGSLISTGSADSTYTTLLAAGFQLQSNNNGGTGVLSFTTAGDAAAAASKLLSQSHNQGGF